MPESSCIAPHSNAIYVRRTACFLISAARDAWDASFFATTSRPEVSLSMRWTIPGRMTPPIPERLLPQCARRAFTSVPSGFPAAGCTTIPDGLFMTIMSSSSYMTSSGISSGCASAGRGAGSDTVIVSPARSFCRFAETFPHTVTRPSSQSRAAADLLSCPGAGESSAEASSGEASAKNASSLSPLLSFGTVKRIMTSPA